MSWHKLLKLLYFLSILLLLPCRPAAALNPSQFCEAIQFAIQIQKGEIQTKDIYLIERHSLALSSAECNRPSELGRYAQRFAKLVLEHALESAIVANYLAVPDAKPRIVPAPSSSDWLEAAIKPRTVFPLSRLRLAIRSQGKLSPTEDFYRFDRFLAIVWSKGPQAGRVYRVVPLPLEDPLGKPYSRSEIEAKIDERIRLFATAPNKDQAAADFVLFMHRIFEGDSHKQGLKWARFYDSEINQLVAEIEQEGIFPWILFRGRKSGLEVHLGSGGDRKKEAMKNHYQLPAGMPQDIEIDPDDPVVFVHGTYSNALSGIIQERALMAGDYRHSEIPKLTGESRSGRGYTPTDVSFQHYREGEAFFSGGYGFHYGFEYPVSFGITRSKIKKLEHHPGTMTGERVVHRSVPLELISYLFVPYFALDEMRLLLRQQGLSHIFVLALQSCDRALL